MVIGGTNERILSSSIGSNSFTYKPWLRYTVGCYFVISLLVQVVIIWSECAEVFESGDQVRCIESLEHAMSAISKQSQRQFIMVPLFYNRRYASYMLVLWNDINCWRKHRCLCTMSIELRIKWYLVIRLRQRSMLPKSAWILNTLSMTSYERRNRSYCTLQEHDDEVRVTNGMDGSNKSQAIWWKSIRSWWLIVRTWWWTLSWLFRESSKVIHSLFIGFF